MSDFSAFGSMERHGWGDATRAAGYVKLFASASDQAIDRLLDAAGAKPNTKALDLCCGQGNVAEALLSRGCEVVGIDFSPPMLAFARGRAPNATFIEADAQDLPFDDAEFDFVVSNLGICHVPDQPRAVAEARRVLRPAGKFAMTVWCGPDTSPCFAAVYRAIKTYGRPHVLIPWGRIFISLQDENRLSRFYRTTDFPISVYRLSIACGTSCAGRPIRDLCEGNSPCGNNAG